MPQGLQCWDANGNLILDARERLTRVLGEVTVTNKSTGSLVNEELTNGQPWYFVIPLNNLSYSGYIEDDYIDKVLCAFTSNTMSWTWRAAASSYVGGYDVKIIYGVF